MIFTLFVIWSLLGIVMVFGAWYKGEDIVSDPDHFGIFVALTLIEGAALFTTILPPGSGLFAGCLMLYWVFRHIMEGKAILEGKIFKNKALLTGSIMSTIFLILVAGAHL